MRKTIAFWLFALAAVLILAAIPWYAGWRVERDIRNQLTFWEKTRQFPLVVALEKYDRGWFHSSAVVDVTFRNGKSLFRVEHDITQWPFSRSDLVVIRSIPQFDKQTQARLDYFFDRKPSFQAHTSIGFGGQAVIRISSPAFDRAVPEEPATQLRWGGLTATTRLPRNGRILVDARLPYLGTSSPTEQAEIADVTLAANSGIPGTQTEWQSDTKLSIGRITYLAPNEHATVNDIAATVVSRDLGANVMLGYSITVGSGSARLATEPGVGFSNFAADAELNHLNKAALAKYYDGIANVKKLGLNEKELGDLTRQLAGKMLLDVLKGSPELKLKRLTVQTPEGEFSGSVALKFNGDGFSPPASAREIIQRSAGSLHVEVSQSAMRSFMADYYRPGVIQYMEARGKATEQDVKRVTDALVKRRLTELEARDLLRRKGGNFVVDVGVDAGNVSLHGVHSKALTEVLQEMGGPTG